ncbi:MAG TPA: putative manganese transporter, partial [Bacillota bacterium]|nr:putative manganese transporter [Bacillota bacterium]
IVSPAALWAAHVATGGDASFVLLVGKPLAALGIFAFLFVLGSLSGALMSRMRDRDAADAAMQLKPIAGAADGDDQEAEGPGVPRLYAVWVAFVVAAVLAAILAGPLGPWVTPIAGGLAVIAVVASVGVQRGWRLGAGLAVAPEGPQASHPAAADQETAGAGEQPQLQLAGCEVRSVPAGHIRHGAEVVFTAVRTAVKDASEITLWVAVADLAFYAVQQIWGPQVRVWMNGAVLPVTLIAVIVGMIPGCGPQIFLARLYTAGSLPFAAILANSVSQHGDSIFPLLARRRGQAVRVTLTSTALALVVGLVAVVLTTRFG